MPRIINNINKKEIRRDLRKNQTPEEVLLWSKIRNHQIGYKWRRQVSIGSYIVDFYCREKLLAIELDGHQHLDNKEYDKIREDFFKFLGIETLRFWNSEINKNLDEVLGKILSKLEKITSPQPSPGRRG
jgi:very-short-patch-repair endonuclease